MFDEYGGLLLAVLVFFGIVNWICVVSYLAAGVGVPPNRALQVATVRAVVRAIAVTVSIAVWWDIINDFKWLGQPVDEKLVFLIIVGASLPSLWFLWLVLTGRFNMDNAASLAQQDERLLGKEEDSGSNPERGPTPS